MVVFFTRMHMIELNTLQVMLLKRSRSLSKDDMQTFNPWCSLFNFIKGNHRVIKSRRIITI